MLSISNSEEIARLKRQLDDYKRQRRKKASAIEDMEDALHKLKKKRREIEEGLQETLNTLSGWMDRIPDKCKFRVTYFEKAKSRFLNPKSSDALEHTRESERMAQNKLITLEDEVEALDRKIWATEEKIRNLTQQTD